MSVPTPLAPPSAWIGLAILALPTLLVSMDMTILYLATPVLSADLRATASELLWISDIYGFLVAGALIPMGTLGDRIGRRRLLLWGAFFFGIASVLAALASSATMLIAARALLGVAGATLLPSTLALIRTLFLDARQRAIAISVWTTCFTLGGVVGPVIGGVLLTHFHWGSVFLMGVPVMLALLVLGPRLLPEHRERGNRPIDFASAALIVATILSAVWGLKKVAESGNTVAPYVAILAGLVLFVLFFRRQQRLTEPLVQTSLFRNGAFNAALAANSVALFAWVGVSLLMAQYLQLVLDLSPLMAGLWTIPPAVVCVAGCLAAPHFAQRFGSAVMVCAGLAMSALAYAMIATLTGRFPLVGAVGAMMVLGFGVSMIVTLGTDLILSAAPPSMAGEASAISETGAELGGSLGVAILGSIAFAAYRGGLEMPRGIGLQDSVAARDTLSSALAVASRLPHADGAHLIVAAKQGFVGGIQFASGVGAALMVTVTLLFAWMLVRRGATAVASREGVAR